MSYSFVYTTVALLNLGSVHPGLDAETMRRPDPPPPPAAAAPAPNLTAPAPTAPNMAMPAPAPRPVPGPAPAGGGFTAHLASYFGETRAREGWTQLAARAPALAAVEPHLIDTDVPGRGPMVRLTAGTFASRADVLDFCAGVRAAVGYCVPLPLPPVPPASAEE